MSDSLRVILLRYLHERDQMPPVERFAVEWKLLTSRANRDAYAEMESMHRALSFHFAPGGAGVVLSAPRFPWLRVGFFGILGAIAIVSSVLWMQGRYQGGRANAATITAKSVCPICHKAMGKCPHCLHAKPAAAHCTE